jgi:hypothetical protein
MAHFTSKAEMILLLGNRGTVLRLDDQSATADAVEQALIFADQTIRFYTDRYYLSTDLVGNEWVKSKATIIAVNYLSARRGNKELFGRLAAELMQQLEMIGNGFWIPDAVPTATNVPSVRNQKVVATPGPTPLKVDQENSTGGGYSGEDFGPPWVNQYYGY